MPSVTRYPQTILVACPTPWDADLELDERTFRSEVRAVLAAGYTDLYIFGTGGEGYAVDTPRFRRVVEVFAEETLGRDGIRPMVGVIGLSVPILNERIGIAHAAGFRTFQISLPAWGAVDDVELLAFFRGVCGAWPDSRFLNYNLPRTKRVLNGRDYARIIPEVPNLVATKTTSGGLAGAEDLIRHAPELQHFMGEGNFPHGSMYGECSLLASYAELSPAKTKALFAAGRDRDVETLFRLQHELQSMQTDLWAAPSTPVHMDGAYDKMLVKLGMLPGFPLRLLPPYAGYTEGDYVACRRILAERWPEWLPEG
jgi:dihydrodipicolinate synthase/N-acetylneuraminate lyase